MKLNPRLQLVCLSLPLLVFIVWVLLLEGQLLRAQRVELGIRGYDPRDLLSGHYVNYQLDLGPHDPCSASKPDALPSDQSACLCWDQTPKSLELSWGGNCTDKPPSCALYLRGECRANNFTAEIERTYIPEADSPYLQRLPQGSRLILKITQDGRGFVEELKPEGRPYREWIKAQKRRDPTKT